MVNPRRGSRVLTAPVQIRVPLAVHFRGLSLQGWHDPASPSRSEDSDEISRLRITPAPFFDVSAILRILEPTTSSREDDPAYAGTSDSSGAHGRAGVPPQVGSNTWGVYDIIHRPPRKRTGTLTPLCERAIGQARRREVPHRPQLCDAGATARFSCPMRVAFS